MALYEYGQRLWMNPSLALNRGSHRSSNGTCGDTTDCCTPGETTMNRDQESPVHVIPNSKEWDFILQQHATVIVKFTASWCQPCQKIHPVYERLAMDHFRTNPNDNNASTTTTGPTTTPAAATPTPLYFTMIDADECDEVATRYRVAILPTFIVFHRGNEIDRYLGSDESQLRAMVARVHSQKNEQPSS